MYTIDRLLSPAECKEAIDHAEGIGFAEAPITIGPGRFVMRRDIRNNTRVMLDDAARAAALYPRLEGRLPSPVDDFVPCGLNERFRFYRYEPGQAFRWHHDGAFARSRDERSFYTLIIYLNDDFTGGATEFERRCIEPATGRALIFYHPLRHQGAEVRRGTKYVLRTDIMFRRARGTLEDQ